MIRKRGKSICVGNRWRGKQGDGTERRMRECLGKCGRKNALKESRIVKGEKS